MMIKHKNLIYTFLFLILIILNTFVNVKATTFGPLDGVKIEVSEDNKGGIDLSSNGLNTSKDSNFFNELFSKYKGIIMGVYGIGLLTAILVIVISFIKLGKSANNPNDRSKALSGLLWGGISTSILGGVGIIVGYVYQLFG